MRWFWESQGNFNKDEILFKCGREDHVKEDSSLLITSVKVLKIKFLYISKKMLRDLLWGVGSCNYGSWEVPQSAICKLGSNPSPKTHEPGEPNVLSSSLSLEAWELTTLMMSQFEEGEDQHLSSVRLRKPSPPSSTFLFYLGPQQIGWCAPILRATAFTQPTNSKANLIQKHTNTNIPSSTV